MRYETVHEPMTPDSMLRFGHSRGCLGSALCCAKITRCVDNRPNIKSEYSADRGAETDRVDTWACELEGPLTSPARRPVPPSLVPKILQCESMELCHARPFPFIFSVGVTKRLDCCKYVFFCTDWPYVSTNVAVGGMTAPGAPRAVCCSSSRTYLLCSLYLMACSCLNVVQ